MDIFPLKSELLCLSDYDVNNDAYFSSLTNIPFNRYIFFVTLLSIPESSFDVTFKMFDTDDSG